jgi:hypothetical protein
MNYRHAVFAVLVVAATGGLWMPASAAAVLPTPVSAPVNVAGPSGDLYEAYGADGGIGGILEVVRVTPSRQIVWSWSKELGQAPTAGGIAVDQSGNAYVSYNDIPSSETGIVKLSSGGIFISSAAPSYQGSVFS